MSRSSLLLMSAGCVALLLALVLLWQSTRSEALPVRPTVVPRRPAAPAAAATPEPAARTRKVTPAPIAHPAPRVVRSEPAPSMPAPPPALEAPRPPPRARSNRNLHYGAKQLHAQTKAVEPLVRACVANAQGKPTGTAYVSYVVTKRGDKFIIEETGVEPSGTTIEDEGLLQCLHETANGMTFVGLPRDAESIMATRKIVMENGVVTEYKHVTFTYLK